MRRSFSVTFAPLLFAACAAVTSYTQQGFGKLDNSPPSGVSVQDIIKRMGERESAFAAARNDYTFRQDVTFYTINDDTNKPDGVYHQVADITFSREGRREEHVVFAPQNTIERVIMTENDLRDIQERLPFILTTPELPDYKIDYLGKQRVDELDTYVFDVAPKELVKNHRYFQGKAWVDQQDMQIVMVNGMNVPQIMKRGHEDLSPPFTTYYEQIDGKYWFPTYTKAEGTLHFAAADGALSQDVHVKTIIKYTDYKRFRANVTIRYNGEEIPTEKKDEKQDQPKQPNKPQ